MSRLVALEPPYTRSSASSSSLYRTLTPLTRGPRLLRGSGMGRWHRPRSGTFHGRTGRTSFQLWCGQIVHADGMLRADTVPEGELLCGTCEGRAVGAGHPSIGVELRVALVFEPFSRYKRPPLCPAGKLRIWDDHARVLPWRQTFPCPVCSERVRLRAAGGWANSHAKIASHEPVGEMVEPCPFHGWEQLSWRPAEARAACPCRSGAEWAS